VIGSSVRYRSHQVFHRTIEAVWRIESARVIAGLTRLTRDLELGEDLAQEALVRCFGE
jgi:predicted RNA polymerase sigma factor